MLLSCSIGLYIDYQMGYFVVHALNLHIVPEIVTDQFYQSTIDYVENIANLVCSRTSVCKYKLLSYVFL